MRPDRLVMTLAILALGGLSACGQSSSSGSAQPSTLGHAQPGSPRTHHGRAGKRRPRSPAHHRPVSPTGIAAALRVSSASASVVQPQPAAGSCHASGSGLYSEPDPACTPGALNPAVAQATITRTICVSGYSETIRPSESITEHEKVASMLAYGDPGSPGDYEYDHLVSLELGGASNDARNLWPEPGGSPNPKDSVENALHRMVCDGEMQLSRAQRIIATGWVAWAKGHGPGAGSAPPSTQSAPTPAPPSSSRPDKPASEVNCSDFSTHAAAQQWFERHGGSPSNDVAGLDADHDGLACESLP